MRASGGTTERAPVQKIRTQEGEVAWVEAGPIEAMGVVRPPLVLLHGFTGHRDDWAGVLPKLAADRRVLAPDLRGHGDSDSESGSLGWSFAQWVKDLFAWLDALEIDRCDLLGHSVGGFIALRAVLEDPARFRSLILVCTSAERPETMDPQLFQKAAAIAEARGIDGLQVIVEKAGRATAQPAPSEEYWRHHRYRYKGLTPASYRGFGEAFLASESLADRLGDIGQRTLVIVGENDTEWLPGAALLESRLPSVHRMTIENAEHHPHQEAPEAFMRAMRAHLARVEEDEQAIAAQ